MVVEAIVGTVATFARGGYDVVVDGIVGPWFLPAFRALAERDQLTLSCVVLQPDLDTTLARAKERMGHELRDVDAITGLHRALAQLGNLEHHAIDTGDLNAEQTSAEGRRILASGKYRFAWVGGPDHVLLVPLSGTNGLTARVRAPLHARASIRRDVENRWRPRLLCCDDAPVVQPLLQSDRRAGVN